MSDEATASGGAATESAANTTTESDSVPPDRAGSGSGSDAQASDGPGGDTLSGRIDNTAGDAFDKLARDAYERGREVFDPTTVIAGRDAAVTIRTHLVVAGGSTRPSAPGPMHQDQLAQMLRQYVSVPDYDDLRGFLRQRALLVLTGQPGTGRTTTAIHLLNDVAGGAVFRLDPGATIVDLGESDVEPARGYLGVVVDTDPRMSAVAADRFADILTRRSAFCVLVVADQAEARIPLAAYAAPCHPPDPFDLVDQHIEAGLDPAEAPDLDPTAAADLGRRLRTLATDSRIREALGPAPRTPEAAGLAQLLLSHGRGEIGLHEVEAGLRVFVDDQITRWLAVLDGPTHGDRGDRARRLTALRIALAVFDGLPAYLARSAAENLASRMAEPVGEPGPRAGRQSTSQFVTRPRPLNGTDDRNLLASTRLVQEHGSVTFRGAEVPGDVLSFADRRMPSALLRHVWTQRPALRPPIITWLDDLSRDPQYAVRLRAAQAAGLLCSVDFGHTFTELIEPSAKTRAPRRQVDGDVEADDPDQHVRDTWRWRREFAALALDHAARDHQIHKAVTRTLKQWRRSSTEPALRWTAATAWRYDIGQTNIDGALEELRVLGTPWETLDISTMREGPQVRDWNQLLYASGLSIAVLFGTGAHDAVLRTLHVWMTDRTSLRKLAVQAVVLMVGLPVSGLGRPEHEGRDDLLLGDDAAATRGRWPVLLALQNRTSTVVAPAADLVRSALRSPWRDVVADTLERWFDLGATDEYALQAVEDFLPLLVVEESDRSRLRALVRHKRRMWADPLPAAVAARLDSALTRADAAPSGGRIVYA